MIYYLVLFIRSRKDKVFILVPRAYTTKVKVNKS